MLTLKQLLAANLVEVEVTFDGVHLTADQGDSKIFLTDEVLDAIIEARTAARRAASSSYKIYATDADGSERMFGILSATDVEDAIAKGKKAGYEVTDAVKV